jgi:hypothetical protein
MVIRRVKNSLLLSLVAPLIILTLAYSIDYVYMEIAQESSAILAHWPYWPAFLALSALFALGIFLYIWYLVTVPEAQPYISVVSLILFLFIFIYRYIAPHYHILGLPPFLARLHSLLLMNSSPRSFLIIATLIMGIGAVITLWRFTKKRKVS